MRSILRRTAALAAGSMLLLSAHAFAQGSSEKQSSKTLLMMTPSSATKALSAALVEVANVSGGRRYDAKLQAVVDADPQFALGRAYHAAFSSTIAPADRDKEFADAIRLAATASPEELMFITALRESRAGHIAVARGLADLVQKQLPEDAAVMSFRMNNSANADESLKLAEEMVKRFPGYAPGYNSVAYRLQAAGRSEEALQAVRKYVELMPQHPNPYDSYGEILEMNGKLDEAAAQYKRAAEVDPKWEGTPSGLAAIAHLRGNDAVARAELGKSLAATDQPARRNAIRRQIAVLYFYEGNNKAARSLLQQSISEAEAAQIAASSAADHRLLAIMAAVEGNSKEALAHNQAAATAAGTPNAAINDVLLYGLLGDASAVTSATARVEANLAQSPSNQALQQAVHFAKLVNAALANDLAGVRVHQAEISTPLYQALSSAYLVRPLRKAGDRAGTDAALAASRTFTEVTVNGAAVRMIAQR